MLRHVTICEAPGILLAVDTQASSRLVILSDRDSAAGMRHHSRPGI